MRGRSIRLSILIVLLLVIAVAALSFREIHLDLPGLPALDRAGTGPLGLKLGLDLRGGGHLVYQADTGTNIEAAFANPVSTDEASQVLQDLSISEFQVLRIDETSLSFDLPLLSDSQQQALRESLEEKLGDIQSFRVTDVPAPTSEQMQGVLDTINRRVNLFGTEEPIIQQFGEDRIIVQLPGASGSITEVTFSEPASQGDIRGVLQGLGYQDFSLEQDGDQYRIRTSSLNQNERQELRENLNGQVAAVTSFNVTGGIEEAKALIGQTARLEFKERTCTDRSCQSFTDADIGLTGDDLVNAFANTDPNTGVWAVNIQFDRRGSDIFSDLTQRIVGIDTKRIAVFLDDEELVAPVARAWIRDGRSQITGNFSREEARTLAIQLESGRLPVPLELIQQSDVDALLGSDSLRRSLIAGLVGLGLVLAFMVVYYRMAGVVASAALIFYAIIVLAVFKLIPITLTLPHIGGFILSIGLAVDANILIFERMKEEIRIGRTLASSMEVGFSRAWPAIRDSNISTLITCGVLLWFGNRLGGGLVTGFALSLLIGVTVSMFTAVVVSRNLLQVMAWIGLGQKIGLFTPEGGRRPGQALGGTQTAGRGR